jgi:hypothetical protein
VTVVHSLNVRAPQVPPYMIGLLVVPLIVAVQTGLMLALARRTWKNRLGGLLGRIHCTLVALGGLAFLWFAWYWNLLGFRL